MKSIKNCIMLVLSIILGISISLADDISIIPSSNGDAGTVVEYIGDKGGKVWDRYKEKSKEEMSLGDQLATGIMTRDTILDYCSYLVKFLGQLALFIGAVAIIYLGHKKACSSLKLSSKSDIGKIVPGILVIIFAYVIVKAIWAAFIS